jgi:hypothetical protein
MVADATAAAPAPPDIAHTNVISDGTNPTPTSLVAQELHKVDTALQLQQATEYFDFLTNTTSNLLELNTDDVVRTALIGIPSSSEVKVIYSGGFGASGIGRTSSEDGKFLFLCGEGGNDVGTPTTMSLPASIRDQNEVAIMTAAQFTSKLTEKGANFTWPLYTRDRIQNSYDIMQLAPIPPFLVYDGLESDLNAALVYERLLFTDTDGLPVYQHAKNFLLSCLSKHNVNDNKPYVNHRLLLQQPTVDARRWGNTRFKAHFPALTQQVAAQHPPPAPQLDIAAQVAAILAARNQPQAPVEEEKKEEDTGVGMSAQELRITLRMCGKPADSVKEELPAWFLEVAAKGTQDSFKNLIIRKNIETNTMYDDAEVPLTAPLVKMISKRNWCGKESNTRRPSILNATEGLSPFIVLDLDEDEVARLNYDDDAFNAASHTTVDDILKLRRKARAKVPDTAETFMLTLRTFANLLFALFSKDCPYLKCVIEVISAIKQFSRKAREAMSVTTKASILWVILLQGRQFATGEMNILAEFVQLQTNLNAKQANITHAEVPAELLHHKTPLSKKRRTDEGPSPPALPSGTPSGDDKKPKVVPNPNTWHPRLKAKLGPALRATGYPKFMQVLNFCQLDPKHFYDKLGDRCTPNTLFGSCFSKGNCQRKHTLPSEDEVNEILYLTKMFHEHPEDFKIPSQG